MLLRVSRARAAATVLIGCAVAAALGVAAFDGERLTNDGAQYLSVADNMRAGHGIATGIIYYEEHYASQTVPAPQTVFPPGYPAAIAMLAATGVPTATAAFVVNLVSWSASIWLLFSIALARGHRPSAALAAAAALACLTSLWFYVHQLLSEPLFLALTLAGTRCLAGSGRRSASWCALAGACAGAAIAVRYAGIFFIAAVAGVFAVELVRRLSRRTPIHTLAFALPALATAAALFWRNHSLVGDFRGGNAPEMLKPIAGVLYAAAASAARVAGLGTPAGLPELAALAALALLAVLVVRARGGVSLDRSAVAAALRDRVTLLCAVYPLVALTGLLYLERTTPAGLSGRMLVPLVPFVLLLALEAGRAVRLGERAPRGLARAALATTAVAYLAGQAHVAAAMIERPNPRVEITRALATPLGETTVGAWLRARIGADHPVLGNEPQLLGAVLGRPVLGLAAPEYTSRVWTAGAALQLVRAYDVEYVVLFPKLLAAHAAGKRPPVLVALAAGTVPAWLSPVHTSDVVRIYRTRFRPAQETGRTP